MSDDVLNDITPTKLCRSMWDCPSPHCWVVFVQISSPFRGLLESYWGCAPRLGGYHIIRQRTKHHIIHRVQGITLYDYVHDTYYNVHDVYDNVHDTHDNVHDTYDNVHNTHDNVHNVYDYVHDAYNNVHDGYNNVHDAYNNVQSITLTPTSHIRASLQRVIGLDG